MEENLFINSKEGIRERLNMKVDEARNLKVGDVIIHKFLKTEWIVIETHSIKSNVGKFRHKLQQKDSVRKQTFTEKGLHLWTLNL